MRRFDLTGRTLAGLLALGLILGGAPHAQAAEADTQGTALTGPAEENSIPPLLPLEPSTPEPAAPASAEQYLAALDHLLNMGLSQEEADSLWLRLGASGIDACLQGEGAEERLSLLRLSFAHPERLDRYQAELARSPETSPEEAVVRVNIGLDAPPYGVGEPVDEPASLTALVNKYHPLPADYVPELELLPPGYTASQGARLRPEACAAFLRMADAAADLTDEKRRRILGQILYQLGRWIYLIDAADDLQKDAVSGNYNPVALRYGLRDGKWDEESRRAFARTLDHSIHMIATAFELWDFGVWRPLLESTVYTGLFAVGRAVLEGTFHKMPPREQRKKHKKAEETT